MTAVLPISAAPTALRTEEARPGRWRRMPTKAKVGAVLLGLFVLAGIIGPFVAPYDPSFQNPSPDLSLHAPYGAHLLGTTQSGQDVLSQMLEGIRLSVVINVGTATLGSTVAAKGLGEVIIAGLLSNNTALILQGGLVTGLMAMLLYDSLAAVERRLLRFAPVL